MTVGQAIARPIPKGSRLGGRGLRVSARFFLFPRGIEFGNIFKGTRSFPKIFQEFFQKGGLVFLGGPVGLFGSHPQGMRVVSHVTLDVTAMLRMVTAWILLNL